NTPDKRKGSTRDLGDDPGLTIASSAVAYPDLLNNRLQLVLENGSKHEVGKNWQQYYSTFSPKTEQTLEAAKHGEQRPTREFTAMDTGPLYRAAKSSLKARIELHQRLALPPACILLALIGLPLGISSRKGGKSAAFVLTVVIAFLYYLGLISLVGLAQEGKLPVEIALWIPNAVLLVIGVISLVRLETPGDRDVLGGTRSFLGVLFLNVRGRLPQSEQREWRGRPLPLGPQLIDHYVLSSFLFYFGVLLVSFVLMTHVFTFFELLSDILRNNIPMALVGKYLLFLSPKLVYETTPVSALVAVLVTFGIMTKNNEITALKACGVSLYRLAVPVLLASLTMSAALFAFDHYVIPDANRVQDAIRAQIKGRPVQTYFRPDFKWIVGTGNRIYYYKYFDPNEAIMFDVNVYELERNPYRLRRHISAERARWEPALSAWTFQNGWARDFRASREANLKSFPGQTATFADLQEPPQYFLKEVKQDKQMNFHELAAYIGDLQQSGFDTVRLQVQYHKKFAVPLFVVIMTLIALPFSFARRGATAGIGVSFAIAISYWAVSQLFEQVGNVNQLPAVLAAWSPDAVFSLAGLYFLARLRT
ncbi:MAG TPA: LptF/LptG family permease, partial [Bryobacteraceae bacterium]|nr:LptF/LptG family permease [Bryobacteraceae bacterium]